MPGFRDLSGQKFGRWTVIARAPYENRFAGKTGWICRCDCGTVRHVVGTTVTGGSSISCGCHRNETSSRTNTTHGLSNHPNYYIWHTMVSRCHRPLKTNEFRNYGGRGIIVCDRWRYSLENFIADMGVRPSKRHSIDRINNDGNYEPGNCRWATHRQQCNNTRRNVFLEFNGERLTSTEWSARLGGMKHVVRNRLKGGWSIERAVTTPIAYRSDAVRRRAD